MEPAKPHLLRPRPGMVLTKRLGQVGSGASKPPQVYLPPQTTGDVCLRVLKEKDFKNLVQIS